MAPTLRFDVSKRGFNIVMNGLKYYVRMAGRLGDDSYAKSIEDARLAAAEMLKYARIASWGSGVRDVAYVSLSLKPRTLNTILTMSDWYGKARQDKEFTHDYTQDLIDARNAKMKVCEKWFTWHPARGVPRTKGEFARVHNMSYQDVMELTGELERQRAKH